MLTHEVGKEYQCHLAGVGHEREHALAEECASNCYAIQSAHQSAVLPHLHALRKTLSMQFGIGAYDFVAQPCTGMHVATAGSGTSVYHSVETFAHRHLKHSLVHQRAHRVRHVYLVGKDDEALLRTIPQRLLLVAKRIPREYAVAICQQQTVDTKVAAYAQQSVGLYVDGTRKYQFFTYSVNHSF